jgi:hypothetical protein
MSNHAGFFTPGEMKTQQENQQAMLDFWRELIDLARWNKDTDALRNIPTDIYMLLGYDVEAFLGLPSEDEELGHVFASGCSRGYIEQDAYGERNG